MASAQTVVAKFIVTNSYGSTLTLDSASCTSGSISAPSTITSAGATFSGSTTSGTTLCTARYHSGSFGCQFQVEAASIGNGYGAANAYEGSGGKPTCTPTFTPTNGNQTATFVMQ
jgi:uncharacterized membrane protein